MNYQQRATQATPAIDEGLRNYMLQVYNYMASGLALTGLIASCFFKLLQLSDQMVKLLALLHSVFRFTLAQ